MPVAPFWENDTDIGTYLPTLLLRNLLEESHYREAERALHWA